VAASDSGRQKMKRKPDFREIPNSKAVSRSVLKVRGLIVAKFQLVGREQRRADDANAHSEHRRLAKRAGCGEQNSSIE
jgi:hypothetical protein